MKKGKQTKADKANDAPVKVMRVTKTNHQTGYHKPVKNPTTNFPKDTHKDFCKRCFKHNGGCPNGISVDAMKACSL